MPCSVPTATRRCRCAVGSELHGQASEALAERCGDTQALSERARHACLAAVPIGDARLAVDLSLEAAHEAEHAYAYDEAAAHYRRGLDAATRSLDPPDGRATRNLTVRLAASLHHAGDRRGLPMLLDAAQQARREGDGRGADEGSDVVFTPFSSPGLKSPATPMWK